MSNNHYDDFKSGIKKDVQGLAWGLFAGIGVITLFFTLGSILIWFFLKVNNYSTAIKTTVGISVLALVVAMLANKQIGNYVYLFWLKLLLIIVLLICASIIGLIVYCMWYTMKDSF
jgi:hypothetical protein